MAQLKKENTNTKSKYYYNTILNNKTYESDLRRLCSTFIFYVG